MTGRGMNKRETGSRYEDAAVAYVEALGYHILERNYRDRYGEIDIIARDGSYVVFLEVKYRRDEGLGYPEEAVDKRKQQRIRHTASFYLYRSGLGEETPCRFDVVSIMGNKIKVIKNAF